MNDPCKTMENKFEYLMTKDTQKTQCIAQTNKRKRCSRKNNSETLYCTHHAKKKTVQIIHENKNENKNERVTPEVLKLLEINKKMPMQRTKEWYELRSKIITASPAAAYLKITDYELQLAKKGVVCMDTNGRQLKEEWVGKKFCNCFSSHKLEIERKCCDVPWFTNKYLKHGIKYEPVICNIYQKLENKKVLDFGIMPHHTLKWLGASPDGITTDGEMIEIKAPTRDKLTKEIILQYWIQMQLQMEVCDLNVCYFIEARIKEYKTPDEYYADKYFNETGELEYSKASNGLPKGIVITYVVTDEQNNTKEEYAYPPALDFKSKQEEMEWLKDWAIQKVLEKRENAYNWLFYNASIPHFFINYYKVVEWDIRTVQRDKKWFELRKNDLKNISDTIDKYRAEGFPEHLRVKTRKKPAQSLPNMHKASDCWFDDSEDSNESQKKSPSSIKTYKYDTTIPKLNLTSFAKK